MSIQLINEVWKLDLPSTDKFVLISLADQANDYGVCWPSISKIAKRCGITDRAAQIVIGRLASRGLISRALRQGATTFYKITLGAGTQDDATALEMSVAFAEELHQPSDYAPCDQDAFPHSPESDSPSNQIHPCTRFTPESDSLTPEPDSPTPESDSPTPESDSPKPSITTINQKETLSGDAKKSPPRPPPRPFFDFHGDDWREIPPKALVALADDWVLTDEWGEYAVRLGWEAKEILQEAEKFKSYWLHGKGSTTAGCPRKSVRGWRTAWSNWLSNAAKWRK